MSHTGYRSVDGVCSYKRISKEQKKTFSGNFTQHAKINTKPAELEDETQWTQSSYISHFTDKCKHDILSKKQRRVMKFAW